MQLIDEIGLKRAADTAVLQRHERIILLRHYSALLNERSINIHFADIIDDNGKANTFVVGKNTVQKCRFSRTEIAGKQ